MRKGLVFEKIWSGQVIEEYQEILKTTRESTCKGHDGRKPTRQEGQQIRHCSD